MGVSGETNCTEERLFDYLRSKEMLLVLDTCENAIEAVATLVERIVSTCPQVHVLATSREILRTSGERVFRLPPLEFPQRSMSMAASEMRNYPAVQLFLERAAETPAEHQLCLGEIEMIQRVCEDLDGVPLAIELAARRVRALGLPGLPSALTDDLFSASYGERTGPGRHQSLRAALDWSLDPLPENERLALLRLAGIQGAFDLDEGIAIASDFATTRAETAACIANLVSKSLVERQGFGKVNFRLLESVRRYVLRKFTPHAQPMMQRSGGNGIAPHLDGYCALSVAGLLCLSRSWGSLENCEKHHQRRN